MASDTPTAPAVQQVPATALRVTVTTEGDAFVLLPQGEIDLATAPLLASCLERAADQSDGPIIVDLKAVTFLDSTTLSVLLRADHHLTSTGRHMTVRNPMGVVRRVLRITGLDERFGISGR